MMHEIREVNGVRTERGNPYLYGAILSGPGCNFAIFSKHATEVTLLLFEHYADASPTLTIPLDPDINRTGDVWHIFVHGISKGQYYGYSVDGPYTPEEGGHRFNKNKLLIDPYTRAIGGRYHWNESAAYGYNRLSREQDLSFSPEDNFEIEAKSVIIDDSDFDWEDDRHPNIALKDSIIYEAHVRSLTAHPHAQVEHPATFLGIIEIIPYLKDLGITTLELLPVQDFNEAENFRTDPLRGKRLKQYWGYSTLAFFAPNTWFATDRLGISAVREFKEMVKALHKAGIELILDVVYNHTGEGNEYGPTLSFKGLDNSIYYMLEQGRYYKNYSGCGNTLNCNHAVVKSLILDSLRYWVVDMHVDGFRFDLAAILGRDKDGKWLPNNSVLADISQDPILSNTKIIAESWDAAGLYAVGGFPEGWAEWNGKFRDDVRAFVKGSDGMVPELAKRITGSADLFEHRKGRPYHSINFITAHDGFSLNDVVSYNEKHNENNGEDNQDGENNNYSWNCGVEGPTDDIKINRIRMQQVRNLFAIMLISQGTPMIASGDEFLFSKQGNNNTYCQDNEFNWLDWELVHKNRDFFEFARYMIAFRKAHPALRQEHYFTGMDKSGNQIPDISWHGTELHNPQWTKESRSLAFMIDGSCKETEAGRDDNNLYIALNAGWETQEFTLPEAGPGRKWYIAVDTGIQKGYYPVGEEAAVSGESILLHSRSMIILIDK